MPSWRTRDLTYAGVADRLGIARCRGIRANGQRCYEKHDGKVSDGLIHWSDRRLTRAGLKRFLLLASAMTVAGTGWQSIYHRYRLVGRQLAQLGFRYPREDWVEERLRIRAMLAKAPAVSRDPAYNALRAEAMAWSRG